MKFLLFLGLAMVLHAEDDPELVTTDRLVNDKNTDETFSLTDEMLEDMWLNQLDKVGDERRINRDDYEYFGDANMIFNKVADDMMQVRVILGEEDAEEVLEPFIGTYTWVGGQINKLIATDCEHEGVPEIPPVAELKCFESAKVASEVIKVVVAGQYKKTHKSDLPKVAQCVKKRVVQTTTTNKCLIVALTSAEDGYMSKAAIEEAKLDLYNKMKNKKGMGWECNDETLECHFTAVKQRKENLEKDRVAGHKIDNNYRYSGENSVEKLN